MTKRKPSPCFAALVAAALALGVAVALPVQFGGAVAQAQGVGVAAKAGKLPAGAKKLDVKRVGKVTCGRVGGKWIPGTVVRKVYFVSFRQQARNATKDARKAKGSKRGKLIEQARALTSKGKRGAAACVTPNTGVAKVTGFNLTGARAVGISGKVIAARPPSKAKSSTRRRAAPVTTGRRAEAVKSQAGPPASPAPTAPSSPPSDTPTTNLVAVTSAGSVGSAINVEVPDASSGAPDLPTPSAEVKEVLIGPDNNLYVFFSKRVLGIPGGGPSDPFKPNFGCQVAQVKRATGEARCVDPDVTFGMPAGVVYSYPGAREAFQFSGSYVYYWCLTRVGNTNYGAVKRWNPATGRSELLAGGREDEQIQDFAVAGDRIVVNGFSFVDGRPTAQWLRRIDPDRREVADSDPHPGVVTLDTGNLTGSGFLRRFPDDNVYWSSGVSAMGASNTLVKRYLSGAEDRADDTLWIARSSAGFPGSGLMAPPESRDLSSSRFCGETPDPQNLPAGCVTHPGMLLAPMQFTSGSASAQGKAYALTASNQIDAINSGAVSDARLMRYFPDVAVFRPSPDIIRTPMLLALGGPNREFAVIAGRQGVSTDSAREAVLYDPATDRTARLANSNEIDFHSLKGVPNGERVYFSGRRMAKGDYVVGYFDLRSVDSIFSLPLGDAKRAQPQILGVSPVPLDTLETFSGS